MLSNNREERREKHGDQTAAEMTLPSYKKDPLGEVENYRVGSRQLQPTPFRANQMMQQDQRKKSPLQRYEVPEPKFWHKYHRALSALAIGTFIFVYTG